MYNYSGWLYSVFVLLTGMLLISKLPLEVYFQTKGGAEFQEKKEHKQEKIHDINRFALAAFPVGSPASPHKGERCDQRPTEIKFRLIGGTCQQSHHLQYQHFYCKDYKPIIYPVDITFDAGKLNRYGGKGGKGGKRKLYSNLFPKTFIAKNSFDLITVGNYHLFPSDIKVTITGKESGVKYQAFSFHTSCSKNLFIGDTFGALKVVGFTNGYQGTIGHVEEQSLIPSLSFIPTTSAFPTFTPSSTPLCPNLLIGEIGSSKKSDSFLIIQSMTELSTCIQRAHEKEFIGFNILKQYSNQTRKCVFFNRSHLLPIKYIKKLPSVKNYQWEEATISYIMPLSDTWIDGNNKLEIKKKEHKRFEFDFMTKDGINMCKHFAITHGYDGFSTFDRKGKQKCKFFVLYRRKFVQLALEFEKISFENIFHRASLHSVSYILQRSSSDLACPLLFSSSTPSGHPSIVPSVVPSSTPSLEPSFMPSTGPSALPSNVPSFNPSFVPSPLPSLLPSAIPSTLPSSIPTDHPSIVPSVVPSSTPSLEPSFMPSTGPSALPSNVPSFNPSFVPSSSPSLLPSAIPSTLPSSIPTDHPSIVPSESALPSNVPNSISPSCVDQDIKIGFSLPNGQYTNCGEASITFNSSCNTKVVETNCPRLCKTCPLCTDSKDDVFMGLHGKKSCSYAQMNKNLCNSYFWLKDLCPSACESCCKDQTGPVPFNGIIGSPSMTCESFKLAKNQKYCSQQRIQKSCPKSCNACNTPPRPCSDVVYPIWVDGGLKTCKTISAIRSKKNYCENWDDIKRLCPVSCGICSHEPTHSPSRNWGQGKGKGKGKGKTTGKGKGNRN